MKNEKKDVFSDLNLLLFADPDAPKPKPRHVCPRGVAGESKIKTNGGRDHPQTYYGNVGTGPLLGLS